MKDYYVILGVLPDAEDIVIKAAYKALVQRYHPDRYKGNAQEAQRKTAELNEAYEVLSNPQKRADYDRTRKASQGSTSDYDEEESNDGYSSFQELDEDWALVVQYYPDLTQLEERLRKISIALSIGFRQAILETKDFDNRQKIANILEQRFLENYFGSHSKILEFALKLILDGKKAGAKELNRTINVVGSKADPTPIIEKFMVQYYKAEVEAEEARVQRLKKRQQEVKRHNAQHYFLFAILSGSIGMLVGWATLLGTMTDLFMLERNSLLPLFLTGTLGAVLGWKLGSWLWRADLIGWIKWIVVIGWIVLIAHRDLHIF